MSRDPMTIGKGCEPGFKIDGSLLAFNTIVNLLGQGFPLVIGVVTMPLIIRGLGQERFGLLSLVWIVLGYFSVFDLGLGRASTKFVAEALGKGEEHKVPAIVWTAAFVQFLSGMVGALILMAITPLLANQVLSIAPGLRSEARSTFYMLALSLPLTLVSSSFSGVLAAKQRFELINAVSSPASALTFLISLSGASFGFQLPGIVLCILGLKIAVLFSFFLLSISIVPHLKSSFRVNPRLIFRLLSFGGWVTVSSLAIPLFAYLERFLIASLISVKALAFYAAPHEMISRITVFPASIASTLFPAFSHCEAKDRKALKEIFSRPLKYLLFLMVPASAFFIFFAPEILRVWLGEEFAITSTPLFRILTFSFFLNSLAHVPFMAIQGLGRPDIKGKLDLFQLPIYIGLCCWLLPRFGLTGAALAKLCITVIDTFSLFWLANRLSNMLSGAVFQVKLDKAVMISGAFGSCVLALNIFLKPFVVDIAIFAALIALYGILFLRVAMDSDDWFAIGGLRKHLRRDPHI